MSTLYAAKVITAKKPKAKTVAPTHDEGPPSKKPRTEKQIAAFEKAKATRAKNAEEKRRKEEEEILAKQRELEQTNKQLFEAEEKRQAANERRKEARKAKKVADQIVKEVQDAYDADSESGVESGDITISQELEDAIAAELAEDEVVKKRKAARLAKKQVNDALLKDNTRMDDPVVEEKPIEVVEEEEAPPNWFHKYIESVKKQQNGVDGIKKSQKTVKEEAKHMAQERWSQPQVRQQVHKQVDDHMDRMYKQIFFGHR
jgi:hypothetical protein